MNTETTEATLVIVLVLAVAVYFWLRNRTGNEWNEIARALDRF